MPTTQDVLYYLPKLVAFVEQPLDWVLLLLVIGFVLLVRRRERSARRFFVAALALMTTLGFAVVPEIALRAIENRYPPTNRALEEFEGVVVLGGGVDGGMEPLERGRTSLNSSAERATATLELARQFPRYKILLTGWTGGTFEGGLTEAEATARFFERLGLPRTRVILEPTARNTAEIASNAKAISDVDPSKPWLLVTSAWNMPRAIGAFRKTGWNVEPFPVDYMTGLTLRRWRFSPQTGAALWSVILHESLGILWYRATGRL
jgi:uncharacterized SAM-binding protein YcdF (DUF218 family)